MGYLNVSKGAFGCLLMTFGVGMAACSAAPSPESGRATPAPASAVEAAYSWFNVINAKNVSQSASYFAPGHEGMMNWNSGDTGEWPTFSNVQCKPLSEKATNQKDVLCSFKESGPPGTQLDSFWTITFRKQPNGSWLIINYGTG